MPSESIQRIAFIGTRGHFGNVLHELPSAGPIEMVGVCAGGDSVEAIVKRAGEAGHRAKTFEHVEQMLDEAKPTICVVCGPFELHASHTLAALKRDIHVIAEKPVALTWKELEELDLATAAKPNVQLAGMMFSRFDPGFFHAKELIQQGAIGEVRLINVRKSYKLGKRGAFYADRTTYGGTIPWVGSHAIDWMMWYADATPARVYATHSARENGGNGTMERSACCLFEFDREVSATVSIDVYRPEAAPSHGDDWARVVGTTGTIEVRSDRIDIVDAAGTRSITPPKPARNFLQTFIAQIAGTAPAVVDARQTLDLTKALLAARQSADERRVIEIR